MTLEELEEWFKEEFNKPRPPLIIYTSEEGIKIFEDAIKQTKDYSSMDRIWDS